MTVDILRSESKILKNKNLKSPKLTNVLNIASFDEKS